MIKRRNIYAWTETFTLPGDKLCVWNL